MTSKTIKNFLSLSYTEKLKEITNIPKEAIVDYIKQKGVSIDNKIIPLIKFNYPDIDKEYELTQWVNKEDFNTRSIIKSIYNKEFTIDELECVIAEYNISNRRVGSIAKVYPHLYKNAMPDGNDYLYSKILMAIEYKNKDYLIKHVDFIKEHIYTDEKIKKVLSAVPELYMYLDKDMYTDDDVMQFINTHNYMSAYLKDDINIIKYWARWNTTQFNSINSECLLNYAIDNNLDIHDLSELIAVKFSSQIIEKYAYYFDFYNTHFSHICTQSFKLNALKDPYNLLHMDFNDKELQREFVKQSNNNLYDALYVVQQLPIDLGYIIKEFDDIHTALSTYPVLTHYVEKKHLTPFIYNLMITLDSRVFEYI